MGRWAICPKDSSDFWEDWRESCEAAPLNCSMEGMDRSLTCLILGRIAVYTS